MFELFVTNRQDETHLEEISFKELFYEPISSMFGYLQEEGYPIKMEGYFPEKSVFIKPDYVMRIINNITYNILKYADKEKPILISVCEIDKTQITLTVENQINTNANSEKGTGLGHKIVKTMMKQMKGSCEIV